MKDFELQGRLKELVVEWLKNREEWSGLFKLPNANLERVFEYFVNDEVLFLFFKCRPIMLKILFVTMIIHLFIVRNLA